MIDARHFHSFFEFNSLIKIPVSTLKENKAKETMLGTKNIGTNIEKACVQKAVHGNPEKAG